MKRRDFLGGMGLAAAGSLMISDSTNARANPGVQFAKVLRIVLGYSNCRQTGLFADHPFDVWEGPCRPSAGKRPQQERAADDLSPCGLWRTARHRSRRGRCEDGMKKFAENLRTNLSPDIRLLEPCFWIIRRLLIRPEQLAKLERTETKLISICSRARFCLPATIIAETFKKPVVLGGGFGARDAVAYLKARGWKVMRFSIRSLIPPLPDENAKGVSADQHTHYHR